RRKFKMIVAHNSEVDASKSQPRYAECGNDGIYTTSVGLSEFGYCLHNPFLGKFSRPFQQNQRCLLPVIAATLQLGLSTLPDVHELALFRRTGCSDHHADSH